MGDLALALATTRTRASEALIDAAGVAIEATASRELVALRDTVPVTVTVYNQGKTPISVESVSLIGQSGTASKQARTIPPDSSARQALDVSRQRRRPGRGGCVAHSRATCSRSRSPR